MASCIIQTSGKSPLEKPTEKTTNGPLSKCGFQSQIARASMASAATVAGAANATLSRLPPPPPPPCRRRFQACSCNLRPVPAAATSKMEPAPVITDRRGTALGPPVAAVAARKLLDDSEIEPRGVRDYIDWSRNLVRPDGGPPRWFSPLECGSCQKGSPLLLFLPGSCSNSSLAPQFYSMSP